MTALKALEMFALPLSALLVSSTIILPALGRRQPPIARSWGRWPVGVKIVRGHTAILLLLRRIALWWKGPAGWGPSIPATLLLPIKGSRRLAVYGLLLLRRYSLTIRRRTLALSVRVLLIGLPLTLVIAQGRSCWWASAVERCIGPRESGWHVLWLRIEVISPHPGNISEISELVPWHAPSLPAAAPSEDTSNARDTGQTAAVAGVEANMVFAASNVLRGEEIEIVTATGPSLNHVEHVAMQFGVLVS